MSYGIVFAEIFAGCLLATAAIALRIRLERIRDHGLRTKVGGQACRAVPFRTK